MIMTTTSKDEKSKKEQVNTTIILKRLIEALAKDKPPNVNWFDYIINHPNTDILQIVMDHTRNLERPSPQILGLSHPRSSGYNPFTNEEMQDISQRMRVAIYEK